MINELLNRRGLIMGSGSAIDWESIARGMIDCTTSFEIPSSIAVIPTDYLFYKKTGLTNVYISNNATEIGDSAFKGCTGLVNVTMEDNSIVEIKNSAFHSCSALTEIVIPEGVTKIGERCFSGCTSLTSITLPSTLTTIGTYFTYNSKIESITVPASVTSIGNYFMPGNTKLKEIIMLPTAPPTLGGVNLATWGSTTYTIYVPDNSVSAYQSANNWSSFASKIKPISQRPT